MKVLAGFFCFPKKEKGPKMVKTKTAKKKTKTKKSATSPLPSIHEKIMFVARMLGVNSAQVDTISDMVRKTLLGLGKAETHTGGRTIVYAQRAFPFQFVGAKHVTRAKALVKDPIDCPLAKALQDSWIGPYVTSVHVGNAVVSMWSIFCPDIVVKFWLSPDLMQAVRDWDEQAKNKTRRFRLADGVHYLVKCPPSFRHTSRSVRGSGTIRGKNAKTPTRRLTVKSDISFALSLALAKIAGKQPRTKK
jgi:hypothetical protein